MIWFLSYPLLQTLKVNLESIRLLPPPTHTHFFPLMFQLKTQSLVSSLLRCENNSSFLRPRDFKRPLRDRSENAWS